MDTDTAFRKDVFAMFVGMALGAMLAHAVGYLWFLGILSGGALGYVVRMLTEPERIKYAGKRAWQTIVGSLAVNWKQRMISDFYCGIGFGGILGIYSGSVSLISGEDPYFGIQNPLVRYGLYTIASNVIAVFFSLLILYPVNAEEPEGANIFMRFGVNFNSVAIHYYILRWLGIGVAWMFYRLTYIPSLCGHGWRFLKSFFRFVHSEDFTACGLYGLAGAVIIFFTVPYNAGFILLAAAVGAFVGAAMRRVVAHTLFAETI
ncbi:MAG: hypothetical protein HYT37_02915 [Candidatus Sungbacteria bacterium]|nr:hypothetical protein [Candidatus Sungbacteria bacterium]